MATKRLPPRQFTSWSFSRYMDWRGCPAKAKYKHLDKLAEPPNAAMERGSMIHKLAEDYTLGVLKRIPAELKAFADEFKASVFCDNTAKQQRVEHYHRTMLNGPVTKRGFREFRRTIGE